MLKRDILIKKYFEERSFVEENIKSFNHFIDYSMQEIVNEMGEIIPTIIPEEIKDFKIKFSKVRIEKPQIVEADGSKRNIYPMEARLRQLSYSGSIFLDVSAMIDGIQRENFTVEILYNNIEDINELNRLEIESIQKYNTLTPKTNPSGRAWVMWFIDEFEKKAI